MNSGSKPSKNISDRETKACIDTRDKTGQRAPVESKQNTVKGRKHAKLREEDGFGGVQPEINDLERLTRIH